MKWHIQLSRYAVVGLLANLAGYLLYLLLTGLGTGPKLAMTAVYGVGVLQTFVFNKQWSFQFDGATPPALLRYATLYALGYAINFAMLSFFVDYLRLPHQLVMAALVVLMAGFFFLGQKFWVFRSASEGSVGSRS